MTITPDEFRDWLSEPWQDLGNKRSPPEILCGAPIEKYGISEVYPVLFNMTQDEIPECLKIVTDNVKDSIHYLECLVIDFIPADPPTVLIRRPTYNSIREKEDLAIQNQYQEVFRRINNKFPEFDLHKVDFFSGKEEYVIGDIDKTTFEDKWRDVRDELIESILHTEKPECCSLNFRPEKDVLTPHPSRDSNESLKTQNDTVHPEKRFLTWGNLDTVFIEAFFESPRRGETLLHLWWRTYFEKDTSHEAIKKRMNQGKSYIGRIQNDLFNSLGPVSSEQSLPDPPPAPDYSLTPVYQPVFDWIIEKSGETNSVRELSGWEGVDGKEWGYEASSMWTEIARYLLDVHNFDPPKEHQRDPEKLADTLMSRYSDYKDNEPSEEELRERLDNSEEFLDR